MSFRISGWVLLLPLVVLAADPDGVRFPPIPVKAGDRALDTERSGHAAPFLVDFSGKGTPHLVLGEFYGGRIWVYRNDGKPGEPKFSPREPVLASGIQAAVRTCCFSGAHPALGDLRGTGKLDLIVGAFPGEISFFRNLGDDTFAEAEYLKNEKGQTLDLGTAASPFLFDWDGTGQLGLLIGTGMGEVHFVPRTPGKELRFGPARKLNILDEKPLQVPSGNASPVAADWDGDGLPDLIVGANDGSVVWFRNVGTRKQPRLEAARELVPESPGRFGENLRPGEWGRRSRPAVVDWNGTGRLDLIVGDHSGSIWRKPSQTDDEKYQEERAKKVLPRLRTDWAATLQQYRAAQIAPPDETAAQKAQREERLAKLRVDITLLQKSIAEAEDTRHTFAESYQGRGQVLLFLRNPTQEKK